MRKAILIIFLLITTTVQLVKAQPFNTNLANSLQRTLDSLVRLFPNTKGMTASVYYPGQGIWTGASGLSYTGVSIRTDMVLGIASNSKLFTATVILKLAENNILQLDDPLHVWLPTYNNINPDITIRQLLNHTSGISDPFFSTPLLDSIQHNPTHIYTEEEVLSWVGAPLFAPGTGYGYSNINYILAGMVAESATGTHISQLIRNYILTPLQLNNTFYDIEEPVTGTMAHRWYNGTDLHDTSRVSLNTAGGPSGSIFSTPGEMAQWYHALMSGQVLSPASFAQLTNFGAGNYGLGIQQSVFFGRTCWGHGGSTLGYTSRVIYDPCMQAVVTGLSNSNPSAVNGITALLYKVLIDNLPLCPAAITGTTTVCQGQNGVTYTLPPITNATSYSWSLPAGVTGSSTTNSITVDYGPLAASGNITVQGINSFGESLASSLAIVVNSIPTAPLITITGMVLHSNAPAGNQWYDQNGLIPGATNQNYTAPQSGYYYVIVTLSGCGSAPSNIIDVKLDVLAIKLLSFTGKRQNSYNLLGWITAGESKNMHFEIERSGNAANFSAIGSLPGTGDSISNRNYQFKDERPLTGINYYRLQLVDPDGKFSYSKIIAVDDKTENPFTIYPNPVKNDLFLNGSILMNEHYQVTNAVGQVLMKGMVSPNNSIPVSKLTPGIYYIKIQTYTLKFLKE